MGVPKVSAVACSIVLQLTMRDGRALNVVHVAPSTSADSAPALVFHHGTPSTAEEHTDWIDAATGAGWHWVSFSRPGYADSTRRAGRSVVDNCEDVAAVLDRLGVQRFVAMGWSGGGPHALACGAALTPRCVGVVTLAGVGPYDVMTAAGLDWFEGMATENHEEYQAALLGEPSLRALLESWRPAFTDVTGDHVAESLGGLVDAPDLAVLSGGYADEIAGHFRAAMRHGVDGWLDDDLAFVRAWGFDLADVRVPVAVWQGEDDRMVPFAHGPFQAERLPDVRHHLLPAEGHLSIPLRRFDEVLADVREFLAAAG